MVSNESVFMVRVHWDRFEMNYDSIPDYSTMDFGLYQIYGDHPVYGDDKLLYIGKAQMQTFKKRLFQHGDFNETHIKRFTRIHIGRIKKSNSDNLKTWGEIINNIEALLISSHFPAYNSTGIKGILTKKDLENILIVNEGDYGSLLPEISGFKYTYKLWDSKKYPDEFLSIFA